MVARYYSSGGVPSLNAAPWITVRNTRARAEHANWRVTTSRRELLARMPRDEARKAIARMSHAEREALTTEAVRESKASQGCHPHCACALCHSDGVGAWARV